MSNESKFETVCLVNQCLNCMSMNQSLNYMSSESMFKLHVE